MNKGRQNSDGSAFLIGRGLAATSSRQALSPLKPAQSLRLLSQFICTFCMPHTFRVHQMQEQDLYRAHRRGQAFPFGVALAGPWNARIPPHRLRRCQSEA